MRIRGPQIKKLSPQGRSFPLGSNFVTIQIKNHYWQDLLPLFFILKASLSSRLRYFFHLGEDCHQFIFILYVSITKCHTVTRVSYFEREKLPIDDYLILMFLTFYYHLSDCGPRSQRCARRG